MMPKLLAWLCLILWMGTIFYFSNQPYSAQETEKILGNYNVLARKLGHFSEFFILVVLWLLCLSMQFPGFRHRRLAAAAFSLLYAFSDEWHQLFVPGRSAAITDVGIDALGIGCGLIVWLSIARFLRSGS